MSDPDSNVPGNLPFTGSRPLAMVTGGARRVGRAIALAFAERGLDVLITFNTSETEAQTTCSTIRDTGVASSALALNLADPRSTLADARRLASLLPRLDVLVHNASTYEPSPIGSLDVDRAAHQYAVNVGSPLALSAGLSGLLSNSGLPGGGAIVAMLDIHTESLPRKDHAAYAMSKAALGAMVRSLAVDLAPSVRVNGVAPGVIAWPEAGPESEPKMQARYLARVPMERAGTPGEAARAVAFLALDATYTTGQVLRVDGGRSLRS